MPLSSETPIASYVDQSSDYEWYNDIFATTDDLLTLSAGPTTFLWIHTPGVLLLCGRALSVAT